MKKTKNQKALEQIKILLNSQHFGVLATQENEYPYCTLVGYTASEDYRELIFATGRKTRKYQNLRSKPGVSFLIDSQSNQATDFKNAQALTAIGRAEEIDTKLDKKSLKLYLKKHPLLKEFVTSPDCALVRIKVVSYLLVSNFQEVLEYTLE